MKAVAIALVLLGFIALVKPIAAITVAAVIPQPLPSIATNRRSPQRTNFRPRAGRRDVRQPLKQI
jgi:hypothetical protein